MRAVQSSVRATSRLGDGSARMCTIGASPPRRQIVIEERHRGWQRWLTLECRRPRRDGAVVSRSRGTGVAVPLEGPPIVAWAPNCTRSDGQAAADADLLRYARCGASLGGPGTSRRLIGAARPRSPILARPALSASNAHAHTRLDFESGLIKYIPRTTPHVGGRPGRTLDRVWDGDTSAACISSSTPLPGRHLLPMSYGGRTPSRGWTLGDDPGWTASWSRIIGAIWHGHTKTDIDHR